ncbi:hypothetical protein Taro_010896 [Colocasia esculenta]|uniref:Uncharacterized protein n=1 Tax=Colocasia esculenta TaxID=4460 RepID=A0A843U929_COLES|nr:hypothetical protein [Colocasia esculenta]
MEYSCKVWCKPCRRRLIPRQHSRHSWRLRSLVLDEVIEQQGADPRLLELVGKAGIARDEDVLKLDPATCCIKELAGSSRKASLTSDCTGACSRTRSEAFLGASWDSPRRASPSPRSIWNLASMPLTPRSRCASSDLAVHSWNGQRPPPSSSEQNSKLFCPSICLISICVVGDETLVEETLETDSERGD